MKLICITPQKKEASITYLKPDTALVRNNEAFYMPEFSNEITARLALVIKIKKMGKRVSEKFAARYYDEVTTGLNLEAQDVLSQNKAQNLPWDDAVGFDYSAPIGKFITKDKLTELQLEVNNKIVESFNSNSINIDSLISEASHKFTLKIGDLIYISLPSEGHQLAIEQNLKAMMNGECLLECAIK